MSFFPWTWLNMVKCTGCRGSRATDWDGESTVENGIGGMVGFSVGVSFARDVRLET